MAHGSVGGVVSSLSRTSIAAPLPALSGMTSTITDPRPREAMYCRARGRGCLLCDRARIGIEQIGVAASRLRAHLGEGRKRELIVGRARAHFFEAAIGRLLGPLRLQRPHRSVPHEDIRLANDQIGRLHVLGQSENARIGGRLLRVEADDPVIDLIEQEEIAVLARGQGLRAVDLGVLAGIDNTDRVGAASLLETLDHDVLGCRHIGQQQDGSDARQSLQGVAHGGLKACRNGTKAGGEHTITSFRM